MRPKVRRVFGIVREEFEPLVIDADGLNAIAGKTGILKKCRAPIIRS